MVEIHTVTYSLTVQQYLFHIFKKHIFFNIQPVGLGDKMSNLTTGIT